jgi:Ras GTPase-activating-like protein IQGAP2/3
MTPAPYRSQGIAGKKDRSNKYGDDLVVGRRLGRHLPRIASGDAGDDWVADEPPSHSVPAAMPSPVAESRFEDQAMATPTRPSAREQREIREMRERRMSALEQLESNKNVNVTPSKPLASPAFGSVLGSGSASGLGSGTGSVRTHRRPLSMSAVPASPGSGSATGAAGGEVTGVAGRLRLSRDIATSVTSTQLPLSAIPASSKVSRTTSRWGLWADTQRHLLQAYEYLCHVGEAQQWIEGCLGEELGFGVVEMDEGLRNGVVLAKLVRGFRGDGSVRRIYEAPKLDFRHSENINVFFVFVREVGLPEVGCQFWVERSRMGLIMFSGLHFRAHGFVRQEEHT